MASDGISTINHGRYNGEIRLGMGIVNYQIRLMGMNRYNCE